MLNVIRRAKIKLKKDEEITVLVKISFSFLEGQDYGLGKISFIDSL